MLLAPARLGLIALAVAVLAAPRPDDALATLLAPGAGSPAALVVAALGLLTQVVAAWLLLVALLTLGARVPSAAGRACRAVLGRCAPAGVRRAVALALGAGLALGLAHPASAAAAPTRPATSTTAPSTPDKALPPLDWPGLTTRAPTTPPPTTAPPTAAPAVPPAATTRAPTTPAATVVVRPGDTLWELAGRSLHEPVSDADRAAEWPRWWAANRDVVGDDPDLLLPGQRLVAPPAR